jgi:uncharacterized membrane protein YgdD (TMEM256/DUF423 family)
VQRVMLAAAGVMGATGIAAAAWAQHGLVGTVDAEHVRFARIAARFAVVHAVALLAMAAVLREGIGRATRYCLGAAAACFMAGFVLFCGGLWLLTLVPSGIWARGIPVGGTLFIVGWLAILIAALAPRSAR